MGSCVAVRLFLLLNYATIVIGIQLESRRQALQQLATASSLLSTAAAWAEDSSTLTQPSLAGAPVESPLLTIPRGVQIPRVGYSLYKTAADEVATGVTLALGAGVRHFDVGTQYGTNSLVGTVLQDYVQKGLLLSDNNELLRSSISIPKTRQQRQDELFVTHKICNAEQSTDKKRVMKAIQQQRSALQLDSIHLGMIHSPLTGSARRLTTYEALLELQRQGRVQTIGVANYGVGPLQEIIDAGLPAPDVIQLILSPFHQHHEVVAWARHHGSAVSCSAWSKLSSVDGPQDGWAVLAKVAQQRNMTKAQVLVKWAVQSGYLCVPRSSAKYKIDRQAIYENSWQGTKDFDLTPEDMATLNRMDEQFPAGRLGIVDGWDEQDIVNDKWDPTLVV